MGIIRKLGGFLLGITLVGCLDLLLKFCPRWQACLANAGCRIGNVRPEDLFRVPWVQRRNTPPILHASDTLAPGGEQVMAPVMAGSGRTERAISSVAAPHQQGMGWPVEPRNFHAPLPAMASSTSMTTGAASMARGASVSSPVSPPRSSAIASASATATAPNPTEAGLPGHTVFKTIGYVERAGGELEAIILQENQVHVVHIGDRIADHYRVTMITPDLVDSVDDAMAESPMAKPDTAKTDVFASNSVGSSSRSAVVSSVPGQGLNGAAERTIRIGSSNLTRVALRANSAPAAETDTSTSSVPGNGEIASSDSTPATSDRPSLPANRDVAAAQSALVPSGGGRPADSLGYVEKADGKLEAVVADGDSVRLVAETPASSGESASPVEAAAASAPDPIRQALGVTAQSPADAQARPVGFPAPKPEFAASIPTVLRPLAMTAARSESATESFSEEIKPIGFVRNAGGEFAAIVSEGDEIYVVRKGDRFGRYRALSVSAEAVQAEIEPPAQPLPSFLPPAELPNALSAAAREAIYPPADRGSFVFQTLGYVQTQEGDTRAIVADGSQTYLVRQGEVFAGQYRATSVDPVLVLAVRLPPGQRQQISRTTEAELGSQSASNRYLDFPSLGVEISPDFHHFDAWGGPVLTNLGRSLLTEPFTEGRRK